MRLALGAIGAVAALNAGCSRSVTLGGAVGEDVFAVRSCGENRVVVRRVCNPEHCRTNVFLESRIAGRGSQEYPIREINDHVSAFVAEVGLEQHGERCIFLLETIEPHTDEQLFILEVEPAGAGGYSASVRQQPNKRVQPTADGRG